MDHYLDIKLLPDPEFTEPTLMNALFSKLHRILVQLSSSDIGASFPGIGAQHLGGVLRLHGSKAALETLMQQAWLRGMRDHLDVSDMLPVPSHARPCRVKRVQVRSNVDRLRRRYQKRHPDQQREAIAKLIPDSVEQRLDLPFLRLKSQSTGQDFPLFIQQQTCDGHEPGSFNAYGFSRTATLPLF